MQGRANHWPGTTQTGNYGPLPTSSVPLSLPTWPCSTIAGGGSSRCVGVGAWSKSLPISRLLRAPVPCAGSPAFLAPGSTSTFTTTGALLNILVPRLPKHWPCFERSPPAPRRRLARQPLGWERLLCTVQTFAVHWELSDQSRSVSSLPLRTFTPAATSLWKARTQSSGCGWRPPMAPLPLAMVSSCRDLLWR